MDFKFQYNKERKQIEFSLFTYTCLCMILDIIFLKNISYSYTILVVTIQFSLILYIRWKMLKDIDYLEDLDCKVLYLYTAYDDIVSDLKNNRILYIETPIGLKGTIKKYSENSLELDLQGNKGREVTLIKDETLVGAINRFLPLAVELEILIYKEDYLTYKKGMI